MSTLTIDATELGLPAERHRFTLTLVDFDGDVIDAATVDDVKVRRHLRGRTDADGLAAVDLTPNSELDQESTRWLLELDGVSVLLDKTGGSQTVDEATASTGASSAPPDALVQAARLDPAAATPHMGTFDVTPSTPIYPLNVWYAYLGTDGSGRFDVRDIPKPGDLQVPISARIRGHSADPSTLSSMLTFDPTAVSYADAAAKLVDRLDAIPGLTQRVVTSNNGSSFPLDPSRSCMLVGPLDPAPVHPYELTKGASQPYACAIKLPKTCASGQTVNFRVWVAREVGDSGGLTVTLETHSTGPSGTNVTVAASVAILDGDMPAAGSAGWVEGSFVLDANMTVDTYYWLKLDPGAGSGIVCRLPPSYGTSTAWITDLALSGSDWVQPQIVQANTTQHARYEFWNDAEGKTPPFLIAAVSAFDMPWVILQNRLSGYGVNLQNEISDSDPLRFTASPFLPWNVTWGMHGLNGANSKSTLLLLELPEDW